MLRNRHQTGVAVQQQLLQVRREPISEWTVRRRLAERRLKHYKPANGPKLERHHKVARLRYARDHTEWGEDEWGRVMFSDES